MTSRSDRNQIAGATRASLALSPGPHGCQRGQWPPSLLRPQRFTLPRPWTAALRLMAGTDIREMAGTDIREMSDEELDRLDAEFEALRCRRRGQDLP